MVPTGNEHVRLPARQQILFHQPPGQYARYVEIFSGGLAIDTGQIISAEQVSRLQQAQKPFQCNRLFAVHVWQKSAGGGSTNSVSRMLLYSCMGFAARLGIKLTVDAIALAGTQSRFHSIFTKPLTSQVLNKV